MPKIRTIKPEFWASEPIASLTHTTRLLFIGLWNFADDYGVLRGKASLIKSQVFPYDELEVDVVEQALIRLAELGLIKRYTNVGKHYIEITGWDEHQRITRRCPSNLPKSDQLLSEAENFCVEAENFCVEAENFCVEAENFSAGRERKGKERKGNGKERKRNGRERKTLCRSAPETLTLGNHEPESPLSKNPDSPKGAPSNSTSVESDSIDRVIDYYRGFHPRARPGKKERSKIRDRLREGWSVAELCKAIDGCHQSDFHQGQNERGKRYDALELIVRDTKHVQDFIETIDLPKTTEADVRSDARMRDLSSWLSKQKEQAQ